MQVYKVIRAGVTSRMYSTIITHDLEYKVDEWTSPTIQNSKLFAFDSINNAFKCFRQRLTWGLHTLYLAVADSPEHVDREFMMSARIELDFLKDFWSPIVASGTDKTWWTPTPDGTILCKRIKLIKEVNAKWLDARIQAQ